MFNAEEVIARIEERVKFLVARLEDTEEQYELLKKENVHLKQELENLNTRIADRESDDPGEHSRSIQQTASLEVNREELRQEIDQYIEEIDSCIAMLKQL